MEIYNDSGFKFLHFLWIIIPHIYMLLFGYNTMKKTSWYYISKSSGLKRNMTIWSKGDPNNKNVLFVVAGGFTLWMDTYMNIVLADFEKYTDIYKKYNVVVVEKLDVCNLVMFEDFSQYVKHHDGLVGGCEELVFLGFSSGGVISSHCLAHLHDLKCKKKIVTYDTPWQVVNNIRSFTLNWFYRIDVWVMYNVVMTAYRNHYNYDDIKHFVKKKFWFGNGAYELIDIVKNIHGFDDSQLFKNSGFNFDQTHDTVVINIFSSRDPFHTLSTSGDYIDANKDKIKFKNIFIKMDRTGHCSNMAFSNKYLNEIYTAICSNFDYERDILCGFNT